MTELADIREATAALRISRQTLRRKMRSGEIAYVRIGDRVLFRQEDLDEFVARNLRRDNAEEEK